MLPGERSGPRRQACNSGVRGVADRLKSDGCHTRTDRKRHDNRHWPDAWLAQPGTDGCLQITSGWSTRPKQGQRFVLPRRPVTEGSWKRKLPTGRCVSPAAKGTRLLNPEGRGSKGVDDDRQRDAHDTNCTNSAGGAVGKRRGTDSVAADAMSVSAGIMTDDIAGADHVFVTSYVSASPNLGSSGVRASDQDDPQDRHPRREEVCHQKRHG